MFRITLHCEADGIAWIEKIAQHLGHVEMAIDALEPPPTPAPERVHPAIDVIERAKEEQRAIATAKRRMDRKEQTRLMMARLSPRVIRAVACQTCGAAIGVPCRSERTTFGMTGHTHLARREAYGAKAMTS
jgi:hypothetical protein